MNLKMNLVFFKVNEFELSFSKLMNLKLNLVFPKSMNLKLNLVFPKSMNLNLAFF